LRLQVNEAKSTVARVWERKFLGYSFWVAVGRVVRLRVAPAALAEMKARVRLITSRSGGRSLTRIAEELRSYLTGWRLYFQLAETPNTGRSRPCSPLVGRRIASCLHRRTADLVLRPTRRSSPCRPLNHRTAGCGPARPVVWEGNSGTIPLS